MPEGVYAISESLSDIDYSNVEISGAGKSGIHNVGPLTTGTVIKWIGAAQSPGESMWKSAPVEGAGNQYLSCVKFKGFTMDCNGLAARGMDTRSHRDWDFDFSCFNATETGWYAGVVTTLGDPCDMQDGMGHYCGRQWEADGYGAYWAGTAAANFSKNKLDIEIAYKNTPAIYSVNCDNNTILKSRLVGHPVRLANRCWIMAGGPAGFNVVRDEVIIEHSGSDPIQASGTSDGFAYPSYSNRVTYYDEENSGHPDCFVLGTGATAWWGTKDTPAFDGDWEGFTVVPVPNTGAFTTIAGATGRTQLVPHGRWIYFAFQIVDKGSAGGNYIEVPLGFSITPDAASAFTGTMIGSDVNTVSVLIPAGGSSAFVTTAEGPMVFNNGDIYICEGFAETYAGGV